MGNMTNLIPEFTSRGIVFSMGHSDADLAQASAAITSGATMVTHMFNAMRPFGHRDPGIFGLLGSAPSRPSTPLTSRPSSRHDSHPPSPTLASTSSKRSTPRSSLSISSTPATLPISPPELTTSPTTQRTPPPLPSPASLQPYYGLISDGIHLSPASLKIAYAAFPPGAILVTDALSFAGLPDGTYTWTNGDSVIKTGPEIRGATNGRLAGVAVSLIDCVNNFRRFTGCGVADVLETVTSHPARMLGRDVEERKGALGVGMDADLVVLEELEGGEDGQDGELRVWGVWKFGVQVA